MTRHEILQRLQTIKDKCNRALLLLESKPLTPESQTEIRNLAGSVKEELQREYNRMLPEGVQKSLTLFERSIYSPTIDETWKESGISRLKIDSVPDIRWQKPLEAVICNAGKYLS